MTIKNTVTKEQIDWLFETSDVGINVIHGKCLVMSVKLPNGFIITESSACVDVINFSEEIGTEICIERIKNKLWELEGYCLQKEIYNKEQVENFPV